MDTNNDSVHITIVVTNRDGTIVRTRFFTPVEAYQPSETYKHGIDRLSKEIYNMLRATEKTDNASQSA